MNNNSFRRLELKMYEMMDGGSSGTSGGCGKFLGNWVLMIFYYFYWGCFQVLLYKGLFLVLLAFVLLFV